MRLTALLALAVAGCAPLAAPMVVPIGDNEWGNYSVLVYDESGLVTGAQRAERQPGGDEVVALPEQQALEIGWTGGACAHQPTLHISGAASSLTLVVRNPADPQLLPFLPIGCPAVGVPLRVNLSLSAPVAQDAVTLEVNY